MMEVKNEPSLSTQQLIIITSKEELEQLCAALQDPGRIINRSSDTSFVFRFCVYDASSVGAAAIAYVGTQNQQRLSWF